MHILYLHQYFTTRDDAGGTRSYEFARQFVAQGHRVTMLTAGSAPRHYQVDGIDVVTLGTGMAAYQQATAASYAQRIGGFFGFALASSLAVTRIKRPDVIFASSTPLTIGIPGIFGSLVWRVPLVFEVRDLWPEAPIQIGALRNPALRLAARGLERLIYRYACRIVALSPGICAGVIAAGGTPNTVAMIPNACDLDLFTPTLDGGEWRRRLGLEGKFVCSYVGTISEANDLIQVVQAAALLQERGHSQIAFVLHGEGKQRAMLEAACRERGLTNVVFSGPTAKHEAAQLMAASDVTLTIFKDLPVLATGSPNKFFDGLAAGRPVIVNTAGWLKELVEQHSCGVYVRPADQADFADQIVALYNDPARVQYYGQNARTLAEHSFDRHMLAGQLLAVLEAAITQKA